MESSSEDCIKVLVRVRPFGAGLTDIGVEGRNERCVSVSSPTTLVFDSKPDARIFSFDHVADENCSQDFIFSTVGRAVTDNCLVGYNGTIFAYGQTGSGKTFTMLGPSNYQDCLDGVSRGLIPRIFEHLFNSIEREQVKRGERVKYTCSVSYLEIYNERLFDLLNTTSSGLTFRDDPLLGVHVQELSEIPVKSLHEAMGVLKTGSLNRRVAETSMNRESSRSHAVISITIKSSEVIGDVTNVRYSRLHLIDLAGSERQKDTKAAGVRLKEAGNINKSLSVLSTVIMSLVEVGQGKQRHVPYRDSKLTHLLKDSLGGNSKTYIVANVHASSRCFNETLSTLQFAQRAKFIKNKAIINENVQGSVEQLQLEIKRLKDELSTHNSQASSNTAVSAALSPIDAWPSSHLSVQLDLANVLVQTIASRDATEIEKGYLVEKVNKYQAHVERLEKQLQSMKMMVKFRDTKLAQLEKNGKVPEPSISEELFRAEIAELQHRYDHHPDVTRFAMENLDLRNELKRMQEAYPNQAHENLKLLKANAHNQELEQQLSHALRILASLSKDKAAGPAAVVSSPGFHQAVSTPYSSPGFAQHEGVSCHTTPRKRVVLENIEYESFKTQKRLEEDKANLEARLQALENDLQQAKQTFCQKEIEYQARITATQKHCTEVEAVLIAHQLSRTEEIQSTQVEAKKSERQLREQIVALDLCIAAMTEASQRDSVEAAARIKSLMTDIEALNSATQASESAASDALAKLTASQNQIDSLVERIRVLEAHEIELVSQHTQKFKELEAAHCLRGTIVSRLGDELEAAGILQQQTQEECDNLRDEVSYKNSQIESQDRELISLREQLQQVMAEKQLLSDKFDSEKETLALLNAQFSKTHDEKVSGLAHEVESLRKQLEHDSALNSALNESMSQLRFANAHLTQTNEQLRSTISEQQQALHILGEQVEQATETSSIQKSTNCLLQSRLEENLKTIADLEQQLETLANQLTATQEQLATAEAQHELEFSSQREEISNLYRELSSAVDLNRVLERRIGELEAFREIDAGVLERAKVSLRVCEEELAKRCNEIAALDVELADLQRKFELREQASSGSVSNSDEARLCSAEVEQLQTELQECRLKLSQLTECLRITEASRQEKTAEIIQLKRRLSATTEPRENVDKLNEEIRRLKIAFQEQHTASQRNVDDLKCRIIESDSVTMAIKSMNAKLESQLLSALAEKSALESELQKCKVNMEGAAEDMELLMAEQERARALELHVLAENASLASQVSVLQEERQKLMNQCAELQTSINMLNAEKFEAVKHQNPNQKIQLYNQLKISYNDVLQENIKLRAQMRAFEEVHHKHSILVSSSSSADNHTSSAEKENTKPAKPVSRPGVRMF